MPGSLQDLCALWRENHGWMDRWQEKERERRERGDQTWDSNKELVEEGGEKDDGSCATVFHERDRCLCHKDIREIGREDFFLCGVFPCVSVL